MDKNAILNRIFKLTYIFFALLLVAIYIFEISKNNMRSDYMDKIVYKFYLPIEMKSESDLLIKCDETIWNNDGYIVCCYSLSECGSKIIEDHIDRSPLWNSYNINDYRVPLECILQETSNNGLACYISNVLNGDQTSDWIYSDDFYKRNGYHKSGMDCSYLFYDPKNRYIYYFEYNI